MKQTLCSLSALALGSLPALAQDDTPYVLDPLVLQVGYESTTALRTGVTVDVITQSDLQGRADTRVIDILARQPGVSVRSNGPLGTAAGIAIRGVSQQNIAVRIDGIDVSDPSGTQVAYDFGGLTAGDIGQIEILRGSQSALYGSESIGGAINITTKKASRDGISAEAFAEFGTYDTWRAGVSLFNRGEGYDSAVTLSWITSEGFSAADEGGLDLGTSDPTDHNDEDDGYEARRLSYSGTYDIAQGAATLDLSAFTEEARYEYDERASGNVFDGSPDDHVDRNQTGARAALSFATGRVDHELSLGYYEIERTLSGTTLDSSAADTAPYNGTPYPFEFDYKGTRLTMRYQSAFDIGNHTRAVLGAEHTNESYTDDISGVTSFGAYGSSQDQDTDVDSLFAEISLAPRGDLDLGLALRHDEHSEFGGYTTGRLSAVWRARPDLIFRGNLANGFRAPSNYELYDAYSGNDTLDPETSVSVDLGVEKRFDDTGFVRATAFWIEARDIIDYSYTSYTYVQVDDTSTRRGLELAGAYALGDRVTLDGSYTWTDSFSDADLDSSGWRLEIPEHSYALGLTAAVTDTVAVSLSGLYEADRSGIDDYGLLNAGVSYDITSAATAYLKVSNLADEDYETVPGYEQPGRAWTFGVRATF
ncbi:TonB-dependent receptor plug domain-containing protein [Salipiger aestuarii]|uniref:TonB-dependent receptor plug domain-containing protein n=1 Tax=Salipiger aestuarii TaxID=568098 RepID=UPI001239A6DE|nr:TonB-dependent receptor [Salipiger aestuarii]KAA8607607.1 TonB-dependent receptor [Salipiger aestuarii]